jgi:pantoate--beta-alanine ligase
MSTRTQIARTDAELEAALAPWRMPGRSIALVPTMGALHEGHLALVRRARELSESVVVSLFVNPTQFAPHEDFSRYPRDEAGDLAKLDAVGGDVVWAPDVGRMYPEGFATRVVPAGAAEGLETDFRPHFFGGVATVCCKLFNQVRPQVAIFGEKDYQQLQVIRQMVRDLDLPLRIIGYPTVREGDGLAMSSRNAYLSDSERATAPVLYRTIAAAAHQIVEGVSIPEAEARARAALIHAGFRVDYVAVRHAETLGAVAIRGQAPLRVLAAAWLGKTRLIDNVAVD